MNQPGRIRIDEFRDSHLEDLVSLSLRAWAPVFESIAQTLGAELFCEQYPDWRVSQRNAVVDACSDRSTQVWVARDEGQVAGFAALRLHAPDRMGEVYMIAVDPAFQRRGIARALMARSVAHFKEAGMTTVMIETGGDGGHAPARRLYEGAGFTAFPCVLYFRKL
jgi:ribosomal protein S18 acetylase RimI-like enzyme